MCSLLVNTCKSIRYRLENLRADLRTQYGGKKGFVYYWYYKTVYAFDKTHQKVDWNKVNRLVFICTGNICRSPYAQIYAQKIGFKSVSFGLLDNNKASADPLGQTAALKKNIDLSAHLSTSIKEYVFETGDILLVFEPYHVHCLKQLNLPINAPVVLLGLCHPKKIPYIRDPFLTRVEDFQQCYSVIEEAIDKIKITTDRYHNTINKQVILVADVEHLAQIAVLRSLGRAGYCVIACSNTPKALGFYSQYVTLCIQHPPYQNKEEFMAWLDETIITHQVRAIIPLELFMHAIRQSYPKYAPLLPYKMPYDTVYACFSKYDLFDFLCHQVNVPTLKNNTPPCYFLDSNTSQFTINAMLSKANFPLYIKSDTTYIEQLQDFIPGVVHKVEDVIDARNTINLMQSQYGRLLLQEHASGVGIGVFFLRWKGKIIRYFMHKRLHEVPHDGGISSYRCSWWHDKIYQDALQKINAIDYNGVITHKKHHTHLDKLF